MKKFYEELLRDPSVGERSYVNKFAQRCCTFLLIVLFSFTMSEAQASHGQAVVSDIDHVDCGVHTGSYSHQGGSNGDHPWIVFDGLAGQTITINVTTNWSGGSTMWLYQDNSGTVNVGDSPFSGDITNLIQFGFGSNGYGTTYTIPSDGQYALQLDSWIGGGGSYTVDVSGCCTSAGCAGAVAYATTGTGGDPSDLYEVCMSTGGVTLIGATGFNNVTGLGQNPIDGKWYAWSNESGLLEIDINTGAGTAIGGPLGPDNYSDMTVGECGEFYLYGPDADPQRFVSVNLNDGSLTALPEPGHEHQAGVQIIGTTVYLKGGDDLFSFDISDGITSYIGSAFVGLDNMLALDPITGIMYSGDRSGGQTEFYTMDIGSGAATLLSTTCDGSFTSLAFPALPDLITCLPDPAAPSTLPIGDCEMDVTLAPPSTVCEVIGLYDGGVLNAANGYTGSFGPCTTEVEWFSISATGNVASTGCFNTVTVLEELNQANEPNAICAGNLTLGLGDDGTVELCAGAYGGLSNDDCSDVTLQVHVLGQPLTDCITFTCADLGPNDICLVVTDCSGNEALCYGTITVQDKRDPYIVCPADITIECHVDNSDDPTGPNAGPDLDGILVPFDQAAFDAALALSVAGGPTPGQDATAGITGFAQGWDNCGATISYTDVSTQDPDDTACGHYSYTVTRTWVITDAFGNDVTPFGGDGNDYDQTITVQDTGFPWFSEPCDELNTVLDCDDPNFELDLAYANTLEPTPNDLCYVTMTMTDSVDTGDLPNCVTFTDCMGNVVNQVSQQIKKTWTAVDACGNETIYEQFISIVDTTAPAIACPYDAVPQTFLTSTVDGCDDLGNFCGAYADLVATATDCQAGIAFTHQIKDGDGNPISSIQAGADASGCYDVGNYCVQYWATDDCGNTSSCLLFFDVVDDEGPQIFCGSETVYIGSYAVSEGPFWGSNPPVYTPQEAAVQKFGGAFGDYQISTNSNTVDPNTITNTGWSSRWGGPCSVKPENYSYDLNNDGYAIPGGTGSAESSWVSDWCFNSSHRNYVWSNGDPITDITQSADINECSAVITTDTPTFSDNCSGAYMEVEIIGAWTEANLGVDNTIQLAVPGMAFTLTYPVGVTTLIYTVYDASGNASATCEQTITVTDDQAPTSNNCPTDITLFTSLDGIANYDCSAPLNWKSPIIIENCKLDTFTCTLTLPDGTVVGPYDTESDASQTYNFPVGTSNVKYNVVDEAGNVYCCTYNVTVEDDEAPAMICQDITVELGADGTYVMAPSEIDNGSNDNCPGLVLTASQTIFNCNHLGDNLITLTGTDAAGNSAECWATVTVVDLIDPVVTCSDHARNTSDVLAGDCGHTAAGGEFDAPASDNTDPLCPLTLEYEITDANGVVTASGNAPGTTASLDGLEFIACDSPYSVLWTVTDVAGNTASCTSIITITDDELPQPIFRPGDLVNCGDTIYKDATLGDCTYNLSWIDFTLADFMDNCDADGCGLDSLSGPLTSVECLGEPGGLRSADFPVGTTDVNYEVYDASGNLYVCTFTVVVTDTQAPLINCPDDQDLNVDLTCLNPVLDDFQGQTDYSDNCPGVTLVQSPASGTSLLGSSAGDVIEITMTATDASGLTSSCTFDVTLVDDEGVNIVCNVPFGIDEVAADANCEVTLGDYAATASYQSTCNPGLVLSPYQDPVAGTVISTSTVVTVSVDDGNGNISSCSFTVIPVDETAPACPALPDVTVDAVSGCSAVATWTAPNADDNCDGLASVVGVQTGGAPSGSTFPAGSTEIEYTYTDAAGNETVCTFNVIITHNEPLTIICDAVTAGMNSAGFADVCAVSFDEGSSSFCGSPLTYQYTTDVDVFGTAAPGAVFSDCIVWTCADLIPGQESTTMEIIFRATDTVSGEQADCLTQLTLSDDTAPQITQCPADVTINTSNDAGNDCFGTAALQLFEATDNCDVAFSYDIEYADGSMGSEDGQDASGSFPTGVSTITYTVEDPSGNRRSTCQTTVTVLDDESPLCESPDQTPNPPVPGSLTTLFAANNGGANGWTMYFDITVGPEDLTIQSLDNNYSTFAAFTGNVYTKLGTSVGFQNNAGAWGAPASGGSGVGAGTNGASNLLLFSPITLLANTTYGIAINSPNAAPQYTNGNGANQTASNADLTINLGQSQAGLFTGGLFNPRVWNGTVNYTIGGGTVSSNEDIEVDAAPGACGQVVDYEIPQGFDNCGVVSMDLIAGLPSGSVFPIGTTFVNYLLTDGAGLTVECGFNVTVNDINPPVLTCPEDIITASDADLCTAQLVVEPDVLDECAEAMIEICFDFLDSPESTSWTLLNEFGLVVQAAAAGTYSGNECVILDVNPGNYSLEVEGFFGTYTVESNGLVNTYTTDLSGGLYNAEVALLTDVDITWTGTGAFQTEMGYEVYDENDVFQYFDGYGLTGNNGDVEETMSLIGGQTYTFRSLESFGDGWHGNTFQLQSPPGTALALQEVTPGQTGPTTNITMTGTEPSYVALPPSGNMVPGPGTNQEYAEYEFTPPSSSGTGELCITSDVLGSGLSFEFTNTSTNVVLASGAAGSFGNDDTQCFAVDFVSGDDYELTINGFYGADAFFTMEDPSGLIIQTAAGAAPQTNSMFAATGGTSAVECSYVVTNADGDVIGAGNGLSGSPAPAGYNLELVTTSIFSSEQAWVLSGPGGIVDSSPFGDLVGVGAGTIASFELDYGTTYTFEAIDSFGDGWDNGTMELQTSAGTPVVLTDLTAGGTTTVITANSADPDYVGGAPIGNGPGSDDEVHTYEFTTPLLTSGFAYPLGENTITWTCVDDSGNSASCSTDVTVNDEQDPNISCPDDITTLTDAGDCFAALSLEAPEVSDNADPCIPAEPDCASNRDVNVIYFDDGSFDGEHAYVIYDGATVVAQQGYGIFGAEGSTIETVSLTPGVTYTFAAIDSFGDGWDGFDVQLQLADDNSVVLVDNLNTGGLGQTTIGNLSSADIIGNTYSGPLGPSGRTDSYTLYEFEIPCTPAAGTHAITTSLTTFPDGTTLAGSGIVNEDFPPGTSTVEYTATDAAGNTSSCTTTINVADEEDPICNAPFAAATYNVDAGECEACITFADFTSADNCMVAFSGHNSIYADSPGENASGCYPVGEHSVKYFSNDMFGNACVTEINFEVIDNEAPTGNAPADITVCNDQLPVPTCTATNTDLGTPNFADNCGIASVTNDDDGLHILGDNLITWTVTDIHGNVSTFSQTVTVEDCNAPIVDCPDDLTVSTSLGGDCFVTVEGLDLDISDNCEIPNLSLVICTDENSDLTSYEVFSGTTQVSASASDPTQKCVANSGDSQSWTLNIGDQGTVTPGSVQIEMDLFHSWKSDVHITLQSPDGTVRDIKADDTGGSSDLGNSFGSNYGNPAAYTFGDGLGGGTINGFGDSAPGSYDPSQSFAAFDNQTATGDWILTIFDDAGGDDGCIRNVTLSMLVDAPASIISGVPGSLGPDGTCTTIPLPALAGDFDIEITNLFGSYEVVTETGTVLASGVGQTSTPLSSTFSAGPSAAYELELVTDGAFNNEMGWVLLEGAFEFGDGPQNASIVATGPFGSIPAAGAPSPIATFNLDFNTTYTFKAIDSFGDGWNGNIMEIQDDGLAVTLVDVTGGGGPATQIVNIGNEPFEAHELSASDEVHYYQFTTPAGGFVDVDIALSPTSCAEDLAWEVLDGGGGVVASAAAGTYTGTDGSTTTETVNVPFGSYTINVDGLCVGGSYAVDEAGTILTSQATPDLTVSDSYSLIGATFTVEYLIDFGPGDSSLVGNTIPFDQVFPVGESTITWNATDENGNTSDDCVTTVTVSDVNPPELQNPVGCDDGANADGGIVDFGAALELDLEIGADLAITDIPSVGITGMFNNDFSSLSMFLRSPAGTLVQLVDGGDYPGCGFIFNGFTVETGGAGASACPGTDGIAVSPTDPLSAFNGESSQGTWTLIVSTDNPINDGGVIFGWTLDVCGDLTACAENVTIDADANCEGTVTLPIPNAVDCDALSYFYSLDGGTTLVAIPGTDVTLTFPLGEHFITWIVLDEASNTVSCGTTVTVEDNTAPVLTCPADATADAGQFVCDAPVTLALATVSDNCSSPTITNDYNNGGADASDTYPVGETIVTFTATDDAGNVSTCETTVTVIDNIDPIISCGSTLNLNLPIGGTLEVPAALFAAASYDNCGDPTITIEGQNTFVFDCTMVGLNTGMTVTATDASGNSASCWIDVLIKDEIAIECTGGSVDGGTADCVTGTFEVTAAGMTPPTFTDNVVFADCPWTIETTVDGVAGPIAGFYAAGTYEACWTATGSDGTTATCCATFTVDAAGDYTCPSDVTVDADANCQAFVTLSVLDNCTSALTVTNDYTVGGADASGTYPLGSTLVTFTITDAWGNPATCSATVTVEDNTDPTIACPSAVNFGSAPIGECSADVTLGLATAADNCSVTITNSYNANGADASDNYPVGTTTVTFTATDGAGNTATCTTDVTVTDVEDPTCGAPADVSANASDDGYDCGAYAGGLLATPTDNCGIASVLHDSPYADFNDPSLGDASGVYPVGTTVVTFFVQDVNGNVVSCTATVTVIDDLGPALSCPADLTVSNDAGACGADLSPTATSSENCDIDRIDYTITFEGGSTVDGTSTGLANTHIVAASAFYPVGTHSVAYTAYDLVGNSATCTTTITVEDNEDPVCSTQDITVALDANGNASITAADVDNGSTDNCGILDMSVAPSAFDCSNTGANTVTLTVNDIHGNTSTCTATVTIEDDETPLCAAQDLTVELDAAGLATITAAQVDNGSSDNCGVALSLDIDTFNCNDVDNLGGPVTVTLTVTDPSGNSSDCASTVTVEDNMAPVLTCPADVDSSNAKGECGNYVIAIANASDNCSVIISNDSPYADAAGGDASGYYPVGSHVVTFVATDPSGNTDTCTTTITVIDDEAPNVLCIELITATLISDGTVIVPACAIDNGSFDNCTSNGNGDCISSDLTYLINGQSSLLLDCSNLGLNEVTLTVIDEAGNSASCETFVDVQDNEAPVISALPQATYSADFDPAASCGAFLTIPVPTTTDLCPGVSLVNDYNGTADASDEYPIGTTTVTWTATDAAGNSSNYSIDVVVGNIPAATGLATECNGTQFRCVWNPVAGTAGYKIFLRTTAGVGVASALIMNPAASHTAWVNNSSLPAGDYEFRIFTGCLLVPGSNPNDINNYATAVSAWTPLTIPCTVPLANYDEDVTETTDNSTDDKVLDTDNANMVVYPNPNIGQFTIETDLEFYTLEVLDMAGKVIFREESLTDNVYRAELSNVESGVYFVRLIGDNDILTKRVVIEK